MAWLLLGACLTALPLSGAALVAAAVYAGYYGITEAAALPGLAPPGRAWQVPQRLIAGMPARRRALIWGVLLGPGLATRNPYAGFWLLPLAVAAMLRPAAGLALGAAIGLAHGTARALALLADLGAARGRPGPGQPAAGGRAARGRPGAGRPAADGHVDLLLKTVYWRRLDGCLLLIVAIAAAAAAVRHFT